MMIIVNLCIRYTTKKGAGTDCFANVFLNAVDQQLYLM